MNLTWNGQSVDGVEIIRLPQGVSLDQAMQTLDRQQDGRDTLGVASQDADYLVLGHGLRAPQQGEFLALDGQPVLPAFLEDEATSAAEGFVDPRDANRDGSLIRTGVVAIGGAIAGGLLGRYVGGSIGAARGARWGAAIGTTVGLPVAGMAYENGIKPLYRRISGRPTQEIATVDRTVVDRLLASAPPPRPAAPPPAPAPLRRINRGDLQTPPPQPTYDPNWRPAPPPSQPIVIPRSRGD